MKFSWHIVGYGVLALLCAGALTAYESAKRDQIRSDAVQQAQAQFQKQLNQTVADLKKEAADRETKLTQDLATLQKRFQQAATPKQIADLSTQVMGLKQPVQIVTPPATPANPNPQPVAQISFADLPLVKSYENECEICKLQLPKLQTDVTGQKQLIAAQEKEITSLKTQRDAAVKASKGGNWIRRTVHNGKVLAIGGAVAVAVVCGLGHCK